MVCTSPNFLEEVICVGLGWAHVFFGACVYRQNRAFVCEAPIFCSSMAWRPSVDVYWPPKDSLAFFQVNSPIATPSFIRFVCLCEFPDLVLFKLCLPFQKKSQLDCRPLNIIYSVGSTPRVCWTHFLRNHLSGSSSFIACSSSALPAFHLLPSCIHSLSLLVYHRRLNQLWRLLPTVNLFIFLSNSSFSSSLFLSLSGSPQLEECTCTVSWGWLLILLYSSSFRTAATALIENFFEWWSVIPFNGSKSIDCHPFARVSIF